jgi:sulfopyruvate decarboxylase TPP-binding subunit
VAGSLSFGASMIDGNQAVEVFRTSGFTHVIWIPDSELGKWNEALTAAGTPRLIRACREGEAIAIAGGLCLGGARPLTILQCTGFFEAGDSFRNLVHDMKLPLIFLIGVRSYQAHMEGRSTDTCPIYTEPILKSWELPYTLLPSSCNATDLKQALNRFVKGRHAGAILLGE